MWMDSDSNLDSICSDSVSDSDSNISGLGLDYITACHQVLH